MSGLDGVGAWVLDLEGTLYRGRAVVPGAPAAVAALRATGAPVRFLTNTTSRSRAGLQAKLARFGFAVPVGEIFCPATAAAAWLRRHDASALLLVAEAAREEFAGVRLDEERPDAVVLGDLGDAWSMELMNRAFRAVHEHGAELIGLVRSRYWLADDGLRLDAGPMLAALEYAAGVRARVFGKPDPGLFEAVLADVGLSPERVAMVGDDPVTDVGAAAAVGMRTVLVRTGKFREGAADVSEAPEGEAPEGKARPDRVVDSIADLPGLV